MPPHILDFSCVSPLAQKRKSVSTRLNFDDVTQDSGFEGIFQRGSPVKRASDYGDNKQDHKRRRIVNHSARGNCVHVPVSPMNDVITAVERLSTNADLVADGSRCGALPTISGKHKDLKAISPQTMSDVINGKYHSSIDRMTIIDCRYPYEFEGGHIEGAVNLYTKSQIETFINETMASPSVNHVLIFHCEFSSERGPKLYRHLRAQDRDVNSDSYPRLNFPEVYLLEGGYKAFFQCHQNQCSPMAYLPMLHKDHANDLRHFRVKSKSWSAGDKPRHNHV